MFLFSQLVTATERLLQLVAYSLHLNFVAGVLNTARVTDFSVMIIIIILTLGKYNTEEI